MSHTVMLLPRREPLCLIPLVLGASSITTLLLYFYGVTTMGQGVRVVLLPAMVLLVLVILWARWTRRQALYERILAGLWAGSLATLAYDLVRVPIAMGAVPVFKAISYFGTVILDQSAPTLASEVVGWTYHLSNGVGFALMYAAAVAVPRWWTAVLWGVILEMASLFTPYAEVFGYRVSPAFIAITLGSHVVYGLVLWAALRYWEGATGFPAWPKRHGISLLLVWMLTPLGIGAVAADFHLRHGAALPPSPPAYLGRHLYTTWNVPEPDRLAALWVLRRFVDPEARFHFVEPFSQLTHGTPFDVPEAAVRRSGTRSATEVLLAQHGLEHDDRLARLARMTHLYEITPWLRPADSRARQLGEGLRAVTGECASPEVKPCVRRAFRYLDAWYARAAVEDLEKRAGE